MTPDRENIRFNVLRNALYHTGRRLTFERYNRWCNFAVILLGAAAMADVVRVSGFQHSQLGVGFAIAFVGALQLVFDFGGRARDHQGLQRDYYNLLADIEEKVSPQDDDLAKWYGQMIRIAGDEPPVMRAMDAKAYNDAIDASGYYGRDQRLHIPWFHKRFAKVWSFEGIGYDTFAEIDERRQPKKVAAQ